MKVIKINLSKTEDFEKDKNPVNVSLSHLELSIVESIVASFLCAVSEGAVSPNALKLVEMVNAKMEDEKGRVAFFSAVEKMHAAHRVFHPDWIDDDKIDIKPMGPINPSLN